MTGGAGRDEFLFEGAGTGTVDRVYRFRSGHGRALVRELQPECPRRGRIVGRGRGRFWAAAGATTGHDADDRLVYNTSNGSLYYDPDGNGAAAAQIVATFQGNPGISSTDITVV